MVIAHAWRSSHLRTASSFEHCRVQALLAGRLSINTIWHVYKYFDHGRFIVLGPPIPCIFILMELATGGNLEEYILQRYGQGEASKEDATTLRRRQRSRTHSQSAGQRVLLPILDIWNFFLDICSGLDHLHQHGETNWPLRYRSH